MKINIPPIFTTSKLVNDLEGAILRGRAFQQCWHKLGSRGGGGNIGPGTNPKNGDNVLPVHRIGGSGLITCHF